MAESGGKSVLIVDDELELLEIASFFLSRAGFSTLTAENGKAALDLIDQGNIDVVVSDVAMPEVSGIELLDRIKARNDSRPAVILMSGFSHISIVEAYAKGAEAVFSKPLYFDALKTAVENAILPPEFPWKRRQQRLPVQLDVEATLPSNNEVVRVQTANVSPQGMFLAIGSPPPAIGTVIEFCLSCPKFKLAPLRGRGEVKWVRENVDDSRSGIGIAICEMDDKARSQLIRFINDVKTGLLRIKP